MPKASTLRNGPWALLLGLALLGGLEAGPARAAGPEAHFRLPGGVELVVAQPTREGSSGFALAWPLGFADDPPHLPGAAWALAQGLWHGGERPLKASLAALGGVGGIEVGPDATCLMGSLPVASAPAFVGRLGEALAAASALGPQLPPVGLAASELGALAADPAAVARAAGRALALGPSQGRPPMALPTQWPAWTAQSLAPVARQALAGAQLRLAFAGGAPAEALVGPAVRALAPLALAGPPPAPSPRPPGPGVAWRSPGGRAMAIVALPGPGLTTAPSDAAALALAARVLSARLPAALKDGAGQALPLWCQYEALGRHGALVVAASCLPGQGVATQEALQDALDALVKGPIALDEWAKAQRAEAEAAEAKVATPQGRAAALALGLVQAKRPGWDDAYPALVRQLSRSAIATAAQAYLGSDGRRSSVIDP